MGREGVELLILHYEGFVRAIEDEPPGEWEGGKGGGKFPQGREGGKNGVRRGEILGEDG